LEQELNKHEKAKDVVNEMKELLSLNPGLVKQKYDKDYLENVAVAKNKTHNYMTTEQFASDDEAKSLLDFVVENYNVDGDTILKTKQAYERLHPIVMPHADVFKALKGAGATSDNVCEMLNSAITDINNNIAENKKKLEEAGNVTDVDDSELTNISSAWTAYNQYVKDFNNYTRQIEKTKTDITNLTNQIVMTIKQIEVYEKAIANNSAIQNAISSKEQALQFMKRNRQQIEKLEEEIDGTEQFMEQMDFWRDILKTLPMRMRQALFEPITKYLNEDFYELFSWANLGRIKIDWDNVDILVGDRSFEQMSGAQQCALGLCIRLALLKALGQVVNIMLIDEPTIHLDDTRISDLRMFLTYLSKQTQLFICTHDTNIIDSMAGVVVNMGDVVES